MAGSAAVPAARRKNVRRDNFAFVMCPLSWTGAESNKSPLKAELQTRSHRWSEPCSPPLGRSRPSATGYRAICASQDAQMPNAWSLRHGTSPGLRALTAQARLRPSIRATIRMVLPPTRLDEVFQELAGQCALVHRRLRHGAFVGVRNPGFVGACAFLGDGQPSQSERTLACNPLPFEQHAAKHRLRWPQSLVGRALEPAHGLLWILGRSGAVEIEPRQLILRLR